jgi:hypothetical protein
MATRRTILKTGMALPATRLFGTVLPPSVGHAAGDTLELERFVYDPRFAEAYDIAQQAGRLGVSLSPVADDLMSLWYDQLDPLWKQAPQALGGVTMAEALFVLETLAMDRGMRLVYRGEHGLVEDGRVVHKLAGPAAMVERFATLDFQAQWMPELASAMTALPLGRPEPAAVEFVTHAPGLSIRDVPLVSWVIAPRTAVALTLSS